MASLCQEGCVSISKCEARAVLVLHAKLSHRRRGFQSPNYPHTDRQDTSGNLKNSIPSAGWAIPVLTRIIGMSFTRSLLE